MKQCGKIHGNKMGSRPRFLRRGRGNDALAVSTSSHIRRRTIVHRAALSQMSPEWARGKCAHHRADCRFLRFNPPLSGEYCNSNSEAHDARYNIFFLKKSMNPLCYKFHGVYASCMHKYYYSQTHIFYNSPYVLGNIWFLNQFISSTRSRECK